MGLLLLAGGIVRAAPPAPRQPDTHSGDAQRVAAIVQYRRDLVSVLALRDDPAYLLGAAILAHPLANQPAGLDFDSLSTRALAAPGGMPAAAWARLAACKDTTDCPNAAAFSYLRTHAAHNAAVWIVAMDVAARDKNAGAEAAAFAKAAAARTYDDYHGKALGAVARAVIALPPLADTMHGAHAGQPDNPGGVRLLVVLDAMQALPRPEFGPVAEWCDAGAIAAHADRRAPCLALAHTLEWGSSPIARAVGLHIHGELDPADAAANARASRDLAWQVQHYSAALQHALTRPAPASRWLSAARNGGTELSLMLATLRAGGVPLEAPADGAAPVTAASTGQ